MQYTLVDGTQVDEEYFEHLSQAAAQGEYPGEPGEWIVRPQGRPQAFGEELVTMAFKVPMSLRDAIDRRAAALGETRSAYLRSAVTKDLVGA